MCDDSRFSFERLAEFRYLTTGSLLRRRWLTWCEIMADDDMSRREGFGGKLGRHRRESRGRNFFSCITYIVQILTTAAIFCWPRWMHCFVWQGGGGGKEGRSSRGVHWFKSLLLRDLNINGLLLMLVASITVLSVDCSMLRASASNSQVHNLCISNYLEDTRIDVMLTSSPFSSPPSISFHWLVA